jgi:hypothetical protein
VTISIFHVSLQKKLQEVIDIAAFRIVKKAMQNKSITEKKQKQSAEMMHYICLKALF